MIEGWDGVAAVTLIVFVRRIPCEVYSRVTGYFRPVDAWNVGKQAEFKDRRAYDVEKSLKGFEDCKR